MAGRECLAGTREVNEGPSVKRVRLIPPFNKHGVLSQMKLV